MAVVLVVPHEVFNKDVSCVLLVIPTPIVLPIAGDGSLLPWSSSGSLTKGFTSQGRPGGNTALIKCQVHKVSGSMS